ncbi:DUF2141 domain-containing protein [Sphingomonas sp. BN140010]|uniref:DUF2141 domain-containing protein n=1 Tax=Sphingomonas arvum TaxID=2992113 RepID=A0ABT3JCK8_9SPHN|nr:DUF2141 domain-containing protein [Sphingomonas sp. BN140010]MCW3796654.1 DUF2141 domain-containing protein [Sphingomonas sp. BN140010]
MIRPLFPALLALAAPLSAATPLADVTVQLTGLRNANGLVRVCLTNNQARFLQCEKVPGAVGRSLPAGQAARIHLGAVPPGTYALLVIHDENRDGRLNMTLGIPREGFGFSNNPAMRPRAPRWDEIRFAVPAGPVTQTIRVRYVL